MAGAPLILARTFAEAHAYAMEDLGLSKGQYRVVNSAAGLSGIRGCDLHLVPGYEGRFDRFKIAGALRYTGLNVIDVAKERAEAAEATPPLIYGRLSPEELAEFFGIDAEDDVTFTPVLEPEGFVPPEFLTASDVIALAANPDKPAAEVLAPAPETKQEEGVKRRRRRCRVKGCDALVEPDDVFRHVQFGERPRCSHDPADGSWRSTPRLADDRQQRRSRLLPCLVLRRRGRRGACFA